MATTTTTTTTSTTTTTAPTTITTVTTTVPSPATTSTPSASSSAVDVEIDVFPAAPFPKTLTVPSQTIVTIAVVGTSSLDVRQIDAGSMRLSGGVAPVQVGYRDVSTTTVKTTVDTSGVACSTTDSDFKQHLMLQFAAPDVVASMTATLGRAPVDGDSVVLELTGTLNGTSIRGQAALRFVSKLT